MSRKLECPGCNAYTSDRMLAFDNGEPCPYCGLSAEATREVLEARQRGADADLTKRYEEAVVRADKAEGEASRLRLRLDRIKRLVNGLDEDE